MSQIMPLFGFSTAYNTCSSSQPVADKTYILIYLHETYSVIQIHAHKCSDYCFVCSVLHKEHTGTTLWLYRTIGHSKPSK